MKLSHVAVFALAAIVQANPVPEPEPDLIDQASTLIAGLGDTITSIASDADSDWSVGLSKASQLNSELDSIFRTAPSEAIAILTSEAGSLFSSLSNVAATATGPQASSARSEISVLKESLARATSAAAQAAASVTTDAAAAPTAFVAMGALLGGVVVFANL